MMPVAQSVGDCLRKDVVIHPTRAEAQLFSTLMEVRTVRKQS